MAKLAIVAGLLVFLAGACTAAPGASVDEIFTFACLKGIEYTLKPNEVPADIAALTQSNQQVDAAHKELLMNSCNKYVPSVLYVLNEDLDGCNQVVEPLVDPQGSQFETLLKPKYPTIAKHVENVNTCMKLAES